MKKRTLSFIIALFMLLSLFAPVNFVFAADENPEVTEYISNGGFEKDIWGDSGSWEVSTDRKDGNEKQTTSSTNGDASTNKKEGAYSFNYWTANAQNIKLTQDVILPVGKYKLSADFMGGGNSATIRILDDSITEYASVSLTAWNEWKTAAFEFEIKEEKSYTVALIMECQDNGYGYVDNVSLKQITDTSDEPDPDEPDPYILDTDEEDGPVMVAVNKVEGLSEDFVRGVDVSSVIAEEESGVSFKNIKGEKEDLFKILKDSGVNTVRIRIWNDPKDENGKTYGGGHNDVATAVKIARRCKAQGLDVWLDFHYSDFWAHPNHQIAPKAWKAYTVDQKAEAIRTFTKKALTKINATGANITIVQIGNETTQAFCGLTSAKNGWSAICKLLKAGCEEVKAFDPDIKTMIHLGQDDEGRNVKFAGYLNTYGVDYDIFATSWYPYYGHGSIDYLKQNLEALHEKTGKPVIVAENSYPITYDDKDGHPNTFGEDRYFNNLSKMKWSISPQGQATEVRDVIDVISNVGDGNSRDGIGICYWEPAWVPVGNTFNKTGSDFDSIYSNNQRLWDKYGSGWATKYAGSYGGSNVDQYWGGSSWDNQTMFDADGNALDSLNVFNYVYSGTEYDKAAVKSYEVPEITLTLDNDEGKDAADYFWDKLWEGAGDSIKCTFTDDTTKIVKFAKWGDSIRWISADVNKIIDAYNARGIGTYDLRVILADNLNTIATLKVKIEGSNNQVQNPGFENGDWDNWSHDGEGYDLSENDYKSESHCIHFWNDSDFEFTVSQTVKADAGIYELGAYIQGGDANENASFKLWHQLNGGEKHYSEAVLDGYMNWQNPEFGKIEIPENGTEVTFGFDAVGNSGCWGTIDDFYLSRLESYKVRYKAGTDAAGISKAPIDPNTYLSGEKAVIMDGVTSTDKFFAGWNTRKDGSGTTFDPCSEQDITMNYRLYPKWSNSYTSSKSVKYRVVGKNQVAVVGTGRNAVTNLVIPSTIKVCGITYKVVRIKSSSFKNNTILKTVSIGGNVENIGSKAFCGCKKLTKITLGNKVTKIYDYAFTNCAALKKITVGTGLKTIGRKVLYGTSKKAVVIIKSKKLKSVSTVLTTKKTTMKIYVPGSRLKAYAKLLKIKKMPGKVVIKKI